MVQSRCHVLQMQKCKELAHESMAASRCHVKCFKDESAHVSIAASKCHVKCFKDESALESMATSRCHVKYELAL